MRRSHLAQDVLDQLRSCLGDNCRRFKFARTRGIPPADCASITVSWIDRATEAFGDCKGLNGCGEWNAGLGLRITITDVCMGPDSGKAFDWDAEDLAAACFDDLVDDIEDCLQCSSWEQLRIDHSSLLTYVSTTYDIEAEGGGYSAYIEVTVDAAECCPDAG